MKVYVALGSNLGAPVKQLEWAIAQIQEDDDVTHFRLSQWYKTEAIGGPADQPDYINAVCSFEYNRDELALLAWLQQLEQAAGRVRDVKWGPRTLDLDIIWAEDKLSADEHLTLPHPRAHQRAFVVQPLLDLGATFHLQGKPLSFWQAKTRDQKIEILDGTGTFNGTH